MERRSILCPRSCALEYGTQFYNYCAAKKSKMVEVALDLDGRCEGICALYTALIVSGMGLLGGEIYIYLAT